MISAITKPFRSLKKKEWDIYHNIGVQHDAKRFSLIDSVLDDELNDTKKIKKETGDFAKANFLLRTWSYLKNKF